MKQRNIALNLGELLFDIKDRAHKFGKSRESEGQTPFEASSNMQGSFDDEDSDMVYRSVLSAFGELRREVSEYITITEADGHGNVINPANMEDMDLQLLLQLPDNFNDAALDDVAYQGHQFVVNRALFDWFTITAPGSAELYMSLSARNMDGVKRALCKRVKPQRPTYAPAHEQVVGNPENFPDIQA